MEAKNPYPKIITDESSGIEVANNDHFVWEDGFEAGIKEVVEWIKEQPTRGDAGHIFCVADYEIEAKLKEWEINK